MRRIFPLLSVCALLLAAPLRAQHLHWDLHEVAWQMTPAEDGESLEMEMSLDPIMGREHVVVRIPMWRPGSYRYANYQDRISNLRAVDEDGTEREILQLDPRAWEVHTAGAESLKIRYTLVATNEADEGATPAVHLRGPMTFMYTEDTKELPHVLTVNLPDGWDFASGHRPDSVVEGRFRSPNYDVFVDCPIALGELERHSFMSRGVEIEWVLFGRLPTEAQFSRQEWADKLKAMAEVCHDIFGSYPFEKYTFLFLLNGIGGVSGLEHLNSTSILVNHRGVKNGTYIEILESVTAHEFFHLWNVKRIRPAELGPFDYTQDVRSTDLWWMEGITSYYNDIIVQRAGMRAGDWFWNSQTRNFRGILNASGYGKISPERSSWTIWNPDRSAQVSYYDSGQMLGLLLDIKIRHETKNQRSMDDVVAFLSRWIDYPGEGYRPDDLQRAIYGISGWHPGTFFDRHVEGLVEPPFREIAPLAGLRVVWTNAEDPYLGMSFGDELEISASEGAPAAEAGVENGDRLLSVDGERVQSRDDIRAAMAGKKPGDELEVRVRRGGSTRDIVITLGSRGNSSFSLSPDPDAEGLAVEIRESILAPR